MASKLSPAHLGIQLEALRDYVRAHQRGLASGGKGHLDGKLEALRDYVRARLADLASGGKEVCQKEECLPKRGM